jgi:predicted component of type VI protein secretion system
VRFVLGDAFDVELQLSLRPAETPPCGFGARLGWTSWLGGRGATTRVKLRGVGVA